MISYQFLLLQKISGCNRRAWVAQWCWIFWLGPGIRSDLPGINTSRSADLIYFTAIWNFWGIIIQRNIQNLECSRECQRLLTFLSKERMPKLNRTMYPGSAKIRDGTLISTSRFFASTAARAATTSRETTWLNFIFSLTWRNGRALRAGFLYAMVLWMGVPVDHCVVWDLVSENRKSVKFVKFSCQICTCQVLQEPTNLPC